MPTPPSEIVKLVSFFAGAFTAPAFAKAQVLLYGAILAPGRRTVSAALRAMGLAGDRHFTNYHRLLNRDQWTPWVLSELLLALIITLCLPAGAPLLLVIDETLERRRGRRIRYKGWFHDPVRSTAVKISTTLGIRWLCLAILVPVPWSQRLWALPFMVLPALSQKTCQRLHKPQRTLTDWAAMVITRVRRWQPNHDIFVTGDGSYAVLELVNRCQELDKPVRLISRLRLDARLYDPPGERPHGKSGRKPTKGNRQPSLQERLVDPRSAWQSLTVTWYGSLAKPIEFITGTALWYRCGHKPIPIRWVVVRCPLSVPKKERFGSAALLCSDPTVDARQIIALFVARWNIEITFEELRACLGFETQRQWTDRAIERTTPCLFGIFSLVVLMAKVCHPDRVPVRQASWYTKDEATFSDVLATIRRDLWSCTQCETSSITDDLLQLPKALALSLIDMACYSL